MSDNNNELIEEKDFDEQKEIQGEDNLNQKDVDALKEEFKELNEEEILEIKGIRAGLNWEEEEKTPEEPDSFPKKVLKKIDHFWEYYKWFVILPVVIIAIVIVFITSYIDETKEVALDVSVVNATSILDTIDAIENRYPEECGIDTKATPVRLEYNFEFPSERDNPATMGDSVVASMQKLNAMVVAGRVDVIITNTWVIDAYSENDTVTDLRDIYDEEYLEENADRIYWYEKYDGTKKPVAFYVDDTDFLGEFSEGEPPVIATFTSAVHTDETERFIKWVVSNCDNN